MQVRMWVILRSIAYMLLIVIVNSCANIQAPTGGEKDIKAPVLIGSTPENKQTNFDGQQVKLTFNEAIEIVNLKNNLLISPYIETNYEAKVQRNMLTLNFEKPFPENTTVTMNFGEAVKDMTEGNITQNLQVTFSTGPFLDSLFIEGNVKEMLSNKANEKVIVTLYRTDDTLKVTQHKPVYYTKPNEEGKFRLSNIKEDTYQIYAYEDLNNNLKFDQQTEKIAFLNEPIELNENITNLDLRLVKQDERPLNVIRKGQTGQQAEIEYNKNIEEATVTTLAENKPLTTTIAREGNKAIIYNELQVYDSLQVKIAARDSLGISSADTVNIIFKQPKEDDLKTINFGSEPERGGQVGEDFTIELTSTEPVKEVLKDRFKVIADSVTEITNIKIEQNKQKIALRGQVQNAQGIEVLVSDSAVQTVTGKYNKADTLNYSISRENSRGDISGTINTEENNFIIELVREDFTVERRITNTKNYAFRNVKPQKYLIRVIVDSNGNGKWDAGRFSESKEPEKIIFYKEVIEVRPNWEIEQINLDL
jgi:uncharacterized protein (DUF2141 family)